MRNSIGRACFDKKIAEGKLAERGGGFGGPRFGVGEDRPVHGAEVAANADTVVEEHRCDSSHVVA